MIWLGVALVWFALVLAVLVAVLLDWPHDDRYDERRAELDELAARRRLRPDTGNVDRKEAEWHP